MIYEFTSNWRFITQPRIGYVLYLTNENIRDAYKRYIMFHHEKKIFETDSRYEMKIWMNLNGICLYHGIISYKKIMSNTDAIILCKNVIC